MDVHVRELCAMSFFSLIRSFFLLSSSKKTYDTQAFQAKEMLDEIFMTANNIDIEYELAGKSVDDR